MRTERILILLLALAAGTVAIASLGRWARWAQLRRAVLAAGACGLAFGAARGSPVRAIGEGFLLAVGTAGFQLSIGPGPSRIAARLAADPTCRRLAAMAWIAGWGAWILWGFDVVEGRGNGPGVVGLLALSAAGALTWLGLRLRRSLR